MAYERKNDKRTQKPGGFKPRRKKKCPFKSDRITTLDYKDVGTLSKFISDRGKILPRRTTGVSAKYQRILAKTIKKSRHTGLLPFCLD